MTENLYGIGLLFAVGTIILCNMDKGHKAAIKSSLVIVCLVLAGYVLGLTANRPLPAGSPSCMNVRVSSVGGDSMNETHDQVVPASRKSPMYVQIIPNVQRLSGTQPGLRVTREAGSFVIPWSKVGVLNTSRC